MSAARRARFTLVAGATAVVIGVGFTAVGLNRNASAAANRAAADTALLAAEPIGDPGTDPLDDVAPADPGTPTSKPPAPKATTTSPKPKPAKSKTSAPTRKKAETAPATSGSIIDQVLAHINAARAEEGLPAYRLDSSLSKASALHNKLMIDGCGLSHRCSGEGDIGTRFSAQGVDWSSAGENIGFGSAGADNSAIVRAANGLTDSMLAEVPPEDGHRKNLLSKSFKRIGLSVVRDGKGIVWMTQDFVG
ncbi:CAP domain-containing protein [Amorphoplanes digitatis]|nr:CAP domain-containing protein [Actinoplanes digitatis]GID92962.1 hypothetical protein Adi01nite_23740 [Actinoplanes digitatis]